MRGISQFKFCHMFCNSVSIQRIVNVGVVCRCSYMSACLRAMQQLKLLVIFILFIRPLVLAPVSCDGSR